MTRKSVEKRRDQVYRYHLLGLTGQQIADQLGISPGQISRYIDDVRKSRAWMNETAHERYEMLLQEIYDRADAWYAEASRIYYARDISLDEKAVRMGLIAGVMKPLAIHAKFVPDAEGLRVWAKVERLQEVDQKLIEAQKSRIEKLEEERRLSGRLSRNQLPAHVSAPVF